MAEKKKIELVFIPGPGMGHIPSTLQIANLLLRRNHLLSITVLLIQFPSSSPFFYVSSSSSTTDRIRFITLPISQQQPPRDTQNHPTFLLKTAIESQKSNVREAVSAAAKDDPDSPTLVGFVLDMFCATMIDVANEFEVPSYIFVTSAAGSLSFALYLQQLYDDEEIEQILHSDIDSVIPSFSNPIPRTTIPSVYFDKDGAEWFYDNIRRCRETSGILVNTFHELESHILNSFSQSTSLTSEFPIVYAVGPILSLDKTSTASSESDVLKWLDEQPQSSVVFLCFGSGGAFDKDQAREIALGLERCGYRFLWSLRKPPPEGKFERLSEYASFEEVLPEGFLDRTADIGRVIGWAPQVEILAHPTTGGFISHCGWNSILESLWYGVPIGTWPMYAEQNFNAFEMVVELGLAVEISLDYQKGSKNGVLVSAEKIECGIRKLMDEKNEVRKLVKAKSEESRKSMTEGGSSFNSLTRFMDYMTCKIVLK